MRVKSLHFEHLQLIGSVFNTVQATQITSRGQVQLLDHPLAISKLRKVWKRPTGGLCHAGNTMSQQKPSVPVNKPLVSPQRQPCTIGSLVKRYIGQGKTHTNENTTSRQETAENVT